MKILSVADMVVNGLLEDGADGPALEGVDLILGCGDLPPEYLSSLHHKYNVPLLYVLGNHDIRYKNRRIPGCQHIDRKIVTIGSLRITGFSGSRWYNGNSNQYTEQQMAGHVGRMRFSLWRKGGVDLVVTHAPPRFVHDAEDPCHKGFRAFRRFIDKYRPDYFIHGHIHAHFNDDSERVTRINNTSVINSYGYHVLEI
jgi:Icc-related predicted phosphoesterase